MTDEDTMTDEDRQLLAVVVEEVRLLRRLLEQLGDDGGDELADKFALYRQRVLERRAVRKPTEEK